MSARPTAREVAAAAGVSQATVSLVLNNRPGVGTDTRQRVLDAIGTLGYRRRGERSLPSTVIGLLIERLSVPAFNDPAVGLMIQGVEREASRLGCHMVLASLEAGATSLPPMVTEGQIGGLIVLGGGDISDAYIHRLVATGLPLVLADNFVDGLAVPCVLGDCEVGGYLATRHLIDQGHRRIAVLEGPRKYKTLTERREGYLRALEEAGLSLDALLMVKPVPGSPRKGYRETQALLALPRHQRPTAIFAISDKTAFGALEALKDAGLNVPRDMALVGFDDIADSADVVPALTTVHLPMEQLGMFAMRRLAELMTGANTVPTKTILYTKLVIRESSGVHVQAASA